MSDTEEGYQRLDCHPQCQCEYAGPDCNKKPIFVGEKNRLFLHRGLIVRCFLGSDVFPYPCNNSQRRVHEEYRKEYQYY